MLVLSFAYESLATVAWCFLWHNADRLRGDLLSGEMLTAQVVAIGMTAMKTLYWLYHWEVCSHCHDSAFHLTAVVRASELVAAVGAVYSLRTRKVLGSTVGQSEQSAQRRCISVFWENSYLLAILGAAISSGATLNALAFWFAGVPIWDSFREKPTFVLATCSNFVQGLGFLPQLLLSRSHGFVDQVLATFMLLFGVKHFLELLLDAISADSSEIVSLPILLSDFVTACVLADFLFLSGRLWYRSGKMPAHGVDLPV
eukprot:TRINITY_DN84134_c0_g1_i1.p1 TRINITY_DN84134_c0_g1~~TRINITY_DN84134_c0_g1_i1.p1  ORF type:complete len:257 (-),score=18.35 TRINITY_DN84134_c0_g1_i1:87-857(-)